MKKEYRDNRVMVVDQGLFVDWALRLSRDFGEVFYHNPAWKQLSPRTHELRVGDGFEEITMVRDLWDMVPQIDLFVFPYLFHGDLQLELVRQGKRVWGVRKGDELENFRAEAKEEMKRLGMPVNDYDVVTGISALREYLHNHPNVYVKIPLTRADTESFHSPSYEEIVPKLREIEHKLDDAAEEVDFVVEQPVEPAIEIGYDGFSVDGQFPAHAINGVEVKDKALIGAFLPYDQLDEHVRRVNTWLVPRLRDYQWRGPLHTEIRVGPDEQPYLIDVTARSGSPPTESMQEMITNWADIMWYGADGLIVDPESDYKYCAQAIIFSEFAWDDWQPVSFPEDIRNRVKLFFHCQIKGKDYVIPQQSKFREIGWVVGMGQTIKEAIADCKDVAGEVSGYKVEVHTEGLEQAVEEIKKGERLGVKFAGA